MAEYLNDACIIVELDKLAAVNYHFQKHGYGPNNVSIPLIPAAAADSADPVAFGAEAPVNTGILALIKVATFFDGFYYKMGVRGSVRLDAFAAEHGYRRKPPATEV